MDTQQTNPARADLSQPGSGSWSAVTAVGAGCLTLVISEFLPIGLLPSIATAFGVSDGTGGLMVTVPGLVAAFAAPLITLAAARVDRRRLLWMLTGVLFVANLGAALAPNFPIMLAARLLVGIGSGGFWSVGVSVAPRLVGPRAVAKATALITSGVTIGAVVSLPLGPIVNELWGWRAAFLVPAGLALVVMATQLATLPGMPARGPVTLRSFSKIFDNVHAKAGLVTSALVFFGHFAAYTYLVPYLRDLAHTPQSWVTPLLLIFGLTGIAGNFATGMIADRGVRATTTAAIVLLAVSVALLPLLSHSRQWTVVLVALWGFAWGAIPVVLQLWMLDSLDETAEGGFALFVSTTQIGLAAGSLLGGMVVDRAGLAPDLVAAAAVTVLSVVGLWAVSPLPNRHPA